MKLIAGSVHPDLEQARREVFQRYRRDIRFTGCGIGWRRRNGCVTDEPVVVAMVTKKLPAGAVSQSRLLPTAVRAGGRRWGVDVVEVGPLRFLTEQAAPARPANVYPITGFFTPPLQGCSISAAPSENASTGTFGCLVRDLSDKTICVLGSNTTLAQNGEVPIGGKIYQPSWFDVPAPESPNEIATLKRFVKYQPGSTNYIDGAIAQLTDQTGYSQQVADNLMKPISADHPVVGLCAFADATLLNIFLIPAAASPPSGPPTLLSSLGVEPLPATPETPCTAAAYVGMPIEKVARTTGYTSSTVAYVNVTISFPDTFTGRVLTFDNLIWTQAFALPGDSGAIACAGGNGRSFVPPFLIIGDCLVLLAVGDYYDLPLSKDNKLTTQIKNQFLGQSLIGNLIIGLIYNNQQAIIDRVKGKHASSSAMAYAHTYYQDYLALVKAWLADPGSTTRVVTQGNLDDFYFMLAGLSGTGFDPVLTAAEATALREIYDDVLVNTKGMNYAQLVSYMNQVPIFEKVVAAITKVPGINLYGTIGEMGLRPKGKS